MKKEEHENALKEHLYHLKRAIDEGIEENQRNIGYNVSQGSVELFAIYLHSLHLIEGSGDQWDHRTFKSKKFVELKLPPVFPHREEILALMHAIEEDRNIICYGKRKPQARIEKMIGYFNELQKIINDALEEGTKT